MQHRPGCPCTCESGNDPALESGAISAGNLGQSISAADEPMMGDEDMMLQMEAELGQQSLAGPDMMRRMKGGGY